MYSVGTEENEEMHISGLSMSLSPSLSLFLDLI